MMATLNVAPKRSNACCYLRGIDEKWYLFYINTKEGIVKHAWYTNPVRGGHFPMDGSLVTAKDGRCQRKFPVLQKFILTKPHAALLMIEVQKFLEQKGIHVQINPVAVQGELGLVLFLSWITMMLSQ